MSSEATHDAGDAGDATRLAAEILGRLDDGEVVDLGTVAERLPDEAARRHFLELVEDARRVQRVLPGPLRAGALLADRFRLVRELGAGGMGRVFEADDIQLKRRVAVKVLTALGRESFDPGRQFITEAMLLAALQHPGIVAVHELGSHAGQAFLVMDLVDGRSLGEVLDEVRERLRADGTPRPRAGTLLQAATGRPVPAGRRPPPAGDDWFRAGARLVLELARTLEAAHERGIVHRDIKPHNVMLRGDCSPVVLDFGLAGTLDQAHGGLTQGLFGTVAYLAPEQVARGRIGADPRTDVYQLGLLLYEILTVRRAFPGDELSALLGRIGRGEFLRPRGVDRGVPADLESVCLKAIELDPERRYASMCALREDLERWVDGTAPPLAARGGRIAAALRNGRYAARRHPLTLAVAGTAAALAIAFLMLRPAQPWTGELQCFRLSVGADEPDYYPDFSSLLPGDTVGVVLHGDQPAYLYALSIFGRDEPREQVVPLPLKFSDKVERPMADTWGVLVQPGTLAACTHIAPAAPAGQHEGLLVFASAQPQPRLANWMNDLQARLQQSPGKSVPYAVASEAFSRATDTTRGEPVNLTEAERAALRQFTADAVLGKAAWELDDPRRWEQYFVVQD